MSAEEIVERAELFKGVVKMKYYGKYRGIVLNNDDPNKLGRIQAKVQAVPGIESSWSIPCVPYAGRDVGFFFVPPVGANVWIEFEMGEPDKPIWSGGFWDSGDVPSPAGQPSVKLIKTVHGTISINDSPGSGNLTIETANGLKIVMDSQGIEMVNSSASIKVTAASVSLNNGALEVI